MPERYLDHDGWMEEANDEAAEETERRAMEQRFPLPGGLEWIVQAYSYPTLEEARAAWKEIEEATRGEQENFSMWVTQTPDRSENFLIVCGAEGKMPDIGSGTPHLLEFEEAKQFVLRRAKFGMDSVAKYGVDTHISHRRRYGPENPMVITGEGDVAPYEPT
jgi:hypothetical protein